MGDDISLTYVVRRGIFRIASFLTDWYAGGTRYFLFHFTLKLRNLDKTFAVRANLHHLFEPLYRDYSIVGKIIGPPVRMLRVAVGGTVYAFVAFFFLIVYIIWILILPAIVVYGFIPGAK